jgi:transglutaminase-like putative cysteine protease
MKQKLLLLLLCVCFFKLQNFAQEKAPVKFGKISPDDFKPKIYGIDSNANAVVIADIGSSEIVGNSKGWFSLEFKHYRRVHILNKNGYDEANVEIELYASGDYEEVLNNVKAVTYNIENGKVVETKLEKSGIFKDKLNKNLVVKKFTFPGIKEGSIIEYEYTIQSDYLSNLQPWAFQGGSPVLWSEYNLRLPEFFGYVFLTQGYRTYDINDRKDNRTNFRIRDSRTAEATETFSLDANVTDYRWVMKNVRALKEESFTSTVRNHIAKIEFQLSDYRYPLTAQSVMGTWTKLTNELLRSEYFGNSLDKNNGWLSDIVNPLTAGAKDNLEKAKRIYAYVRDNFTCTSHNAIYLDQTLKNLLKARNGSVAEINLLLVAMLKYAHIDADPLMLSTRSHGYTQAIYPIRSKFNYVVCDATINGQNYYLDASQSHMGFGRLGYECYNGHARIINADATPVDLTADSLLERSVTSVFIINDEKGNFSGSMQESPGFYESYRLRNRIKDKGRDQLLDDIKKSFGLETQVNDLSIDSLEKYDNPITIKYNFEMKPDKEDIMYINPMFGEGYKENPFKSAERFYPVEMPYTMDQTYLLQLEVPKGYTVDELPKQIMVKLNENDDGLFEYRISESNGTISLRSRLRMKRSYFMPDEYEMLREFFNLVVKKHSEQIVLKKKK